MLEEIKPRKQEKFLEAASNLASRATSGDTARFLAGAISRATSELLLEQFLMLFLKIFLGPVQKQCLEPLFSSHKTQKSF